MFLAVKGKFYLSYYCQVLAISEWMNDKKKALI